MMPRTQLHALLRALQECACATVLIALGALVAAPLHAQEARPNILWITSEDNGPHLGCYGDGYASTPNLDALAADGLRYERAWSNAPVCAPARTTIISGVHASSLGAENMRSEVRLPEWMPLFPQLLREAGYYCTNRSKEDYNVRKPGKVWDVSGGKGHWRKRTEGQPFFAVVNITVSHESQIRKRPHEPVHDAELVRVPAYHPDTPEVRRDWAQYHDKVSEMDAQAGKVLRQLEEDGLREDTIVVYFGDHGSGMPRSKRWPYNSGLHVPLIVSFPDKFRHLAPEGYTAGGVSERLVSFVDLAPTMLSIVGLEAPDHMQGSAFAGVHVGPAPATLHGYRGRMDERYDLVRSVTDGRFVYVKNYMPHRPYGQFLDYMFQTPTTRVWKALYDAGELSPPRTLFWEPKPGEELYDVRSDPDEVENLADSDAHQEVLTRLRVANHAHIRSIRDLGFLPEDELHRMTAERSPYELARDEEAYPLDKILWAAEVASSGSEIIGAAQHTSAAAMLTHGLTDPHPAVRYWAATGLTVLGAQFASASAAAAALEEALDDESAPVRIVTAELLARVGSEQQREAALDVLLEESDMAGSGLYAAVQALGSVDLLDALLLGRVEELRALPRSATGVPARLGKYVSRLLDRTLADLDRLAKEPPPPSALVYRELGDLSLRLWLHAPAGTPPDGGWPAVVFFHGGGWAGGSPTQFQDHCVHLARRGVVGISAEYRLTKKHGTTPFECVMDGKAAVRWVRASADRLGVDPERIAAGGGSAGGHVAAATATLIGFDAAPEAQVSCRPDALVLFNPVFDNSPEGYTNAHIGDRWPSFSPLHNLRADTPPTLVMLGTEDHLIPVSTARRYRAAMQEVGSLCELKLYDGQKHGFFNRSSSAAMYERTVADMDAFLMQLGWMNTTPEGQH